MLDASYITFGEKKNNYVPTLIQDRYIMFTLGSSDAFGGRAGLGFALALACAAVGGYAG